MALHVVTANRLIDGLVVYLTDDGDWVEAINRARVVGDDPDRMAALETAGQGEIANIVTGVYEVEVSRDANDVVPVRMRERIRAFGPTTHRDFSRAHVPGHFQHPDGVDAVVFRPASGKA